MGKKHLKGIVVYGNQAIHIHADPKEWEELIDSHRKILGAHTHSIVSRKPHPMFEYHTPASRWSAFPGAKWGAANPPVMLTDADMDPHNLNHLLVRVLHGPDDVELHGAQHGLLRLPDPLLLRDPRR